MSLANVSRDNVRFEAYLCVLTNVDRYSGDLNTHTYDDDNDDENDDDNNDDNDDEYEGGISQYGAVVQITWRNACAPAKTGARARGRVPSETAPLRAFVVVVVVGSLLV